MKLSGEFGILSEPGICREVMERCLYVINQRLQSLFIEGCVHPPRLPQRRPHMFGWPGVGGAQVQHWLF